MVNEKLSNDIEKFDNKLNNILDMDYKKAGRFVIKGMIIVIIFGTIFTTSRSVDVNADSWYTQELEDLDQDYKEGKIGYDDFIERQHDIENQYNFMNVQDLYIMNIARVFISFGMLYVGIGFMGFAADNTLDDKFRTIAFLLAGTIFFFMVFTVMFQYISITIS